MSTILFIGLGRMGSGMAANLMKAGHDVYVHDLSKEAVEEAVRGGGREAGLADAAEADVVLTMLPAGEHVAKIYLERGGVAAHARQGTLFIDCSTIDVTTARTVGAEVKAVGFRFVDAPVSGGVAAAKGGTLTFMVGGEESDFEAARPVLEAMGKNVFHAGGAGAGQAAKICNNMLLAVTMIGTCEAFNLAKQLGLDAQTFFDISSKASGQSWSMTSYCPAPGPVPTAPSNKGYEPGFAAGLMLKDLRLASDAAKAARAATPLGSLSEQLYAMIEAAGADDLDFSGVMKLIDGSLQGR
jgi:3-hydroxyisobutyrate dehydrogenase